MGVSINMRAEAGTKNGVRWRKDGGSEVATQSDSLNYTFNGPIASSDEGIYEIYYDGERSTGRGGLFRLIVRGKLT